MATCSNCFSCHHGDCVTMTSQAFMRSSTTSSQVHVTVKNYFSQVIHGKLLLTVEFFLLQVRTLFVSGLPMDTKPRELYLLFRAYEVSNFFCELPSLMVIWQRFSFKTKDPWYISLIQLHILMTFHIRWNMGQFYCPLSSRAHALQGGQTNLLYSQLTFR